MSKNGGALAGLKVVDISRVLGGPYCGQILADHGADVVKVEPPQGDDTREWGPPFKDGISAYFSGLNRNKRSVALDLGSKKGQEVLFRLLEGADVLVENFKTGTMEKWGIGYDALSKKFPVRWEDNLPPTVDIGPGSPTGVGFGYGAKFPQKYQDAFYICDWSYGKMYAVHLKKSGAGYTADFEEFMAAQPL